VRRRDLLALAAQLGAGAAAGHGEVWERLADALTRPGSLNETVVRELEARSAGLYLLEEIIPAQDVLKVLVAHLREVSTLLSGRAGDPDDELRRRLIVAPGRAACWRAGPRAPWVIRPRPGISTTPPSRRRARPATRPSPRAR
jgi:hypothetical protein